MRVNRDGQDLEREAFEAERRLLAHVTADALVRAGRGLEDLAEMIPTRPEDAADLRRRMLELAAELRRVFLVVRPLVKELADE